MPDDWAGALRERLVQARFETIFGGNLPIVQASVRPEHLPCLLQLVSEAFQQLPPLTVGGGDAWVSTVTRLVVPSDRIWTDDLFGVPPRRSDDGSRQDLLRPVGEPVAVVSMRRAAPAEDRRSEFERIPSPEERRIPRRWIRLSGMCLGLTAAGTLAWLATSPSGPAVTNAVAASERPGSEVPAGVHAASVPVQPTAAPHVGGRVTRPPIVGQVPEPRAPLPVANSSAERRAGAAEGLPPLPLAPPTASRGRSEPAPKQDSLNGMLTAAPATPAADKARLVSAPLQPRAKAAPTRRRQK